MNRYGGGYTVEPVSTHRHVLPALLHDTDRKVSNSAPVIASDPIVSPPKDQVYVSDRTLVGHGSGVGGTGGGLSSLLDRRYSESYVSRSHSLDRYERWDPPPGMEEGGGGGLSLSLLTEEDMDMDMDVYEEDNEELESPTVTSLSTLVNFVGNRRLGIGNGDGRVEAQGTGVNKNGLSVKKKKKKARGVGRVGAVAVALLGSVSPVKAHRNGRGQEAQGGGMDILVKQTQPVQRK